MNDPIWLFWAHLTFIRILCVCIANTSCVSCHMSECYCFNKLYVLNIHLLDICSQRVLNNLSQWRLMQARVNCEEHAVSIHTWHQLSLFSYLERMSRFTGCMLICAVYIRGLGDGFGPRMTICSSSFPPGLCVPVVLRH